MYEYSYLMSEGDGRSGSGGGGVQGTNRRDICRSVASM